MEARVYLAFWPVNHTKEHIMKKFLLSLALVAGSLVAPLLAVAGISISIGDPNYYGQIQIGNVPPPLIYANPIIVQPVPGYIAAPLYLRVPDYQVRNWRAYCGGYHACNRRVYFVNDSWYRNTYVPQYRHQHYPRQEFIRGPYRHYDNGHHYGHRKYDRHVDRGNHYNRDHRNHDKRH
jgi:hypothetical protein